MARKTPVIPTAFAVPTYSELVASVGSYLDAELAAAGFSWSSAVKYSLPWVLARVFALALGAVYRFQRYIASGILASTARDLEQLQLIGNEIGVPWLSGTRATGIVTAVNASGVDITVPAGDWIVNTTPGVAYGLRYQVTVPTVVSGSSGFGNVPVQGELIGADYIVTADAARFEKPPTGLTATCLITTTAGGTDEEPIEEYRTRILDRIQRPPEGGAVSDWQAWTREMHAQVVDNVWIYSPGDVVPASVDVSGYVPAATVGVLYSLDGTGAAKIPSGANVTAMTNFLLAHADRPVTSIPKAFAPVDNNVPITLRARATSGAVAGPEITALEAQIRLALAVMLENKLGALSTPGATSGEIIRNSWIHDAIVSVGGLAWHEITSLDGGSGAAGVSTTYSWELTRFTVTFNWVV